MSAGLVARDLSAGYHGRAVVTKINLEVAPGQIVALLGANGAGKTTILQALAGELRPLAGEVYFGGTSTTASLSARARRGLAYVTEERAAFMTMSVADNLRVGRCDEDMALRLFPELHALRRRRAGVLSGGEQQMLALARALARRPKILLVDELSLGLAPLIVGRLLLALRAAADSGETGVLMVEQQVRHALNVADEVCVLERGGITLRGTPEELGSRVADIEASYLSSTPPNGARKGELQNRGAPGV